MSETLGLSQLREGATGLEGAEAGCCRSPSAQGSRSRKDGAQCQQGPGGETRPKGLCSVQAVSSDWKSFRI